MKKDMKDFFYRIVLADNRSSFKDERLQICL